MDERLKQLRKALGLNQTQMAESLGISQSTYCQFETGARPVLERYVKALQNTYNANADWLMTGDGDMFLRSKDDQAFMDTYNSLTDASKKMIYEIAKVMRAQEEKENSGK